MANVRQASPLPLTLTAACTIALIAAAISACGYTEGGSGSNTLEVQGQIYYNPTSATGSALTLDVRKNGAPVTGAQVIVTDADTHETLNLPSIGASYAATWPGYHRRLAWQVVSGDDNVTCRIEGPGRHTVTHPAHAGIHKLGEPLDVSWRTADGVRARQVALKLTPGSFSATLTDEAGSIRIGAPQLGLGLTTLSVLRSNVVYPVGAVGESSLTYTYEVVNDFRVEQ